MSLDAARSATIFILCYSKDRDALCYTAESQSSTGALTYAVVDLPPFFGLRSRLLRVLEAAEQRLA